MTFVVQPPCAILLLPFPAVRPRRLSVVVVRVRGSPPLPLHSPALLLLDSSLNPLGGEMSSCAERLELHFISGGGYLLQAVQISCKH